MRDVMLRCYDARRDPRKTSDRVPFVCRSSHGKTLSNANRDATKPIKRSNRHIKFVSFDVKFLANLDLI